MNDLGIGSFGPEKEGWFDGPALLQAFRRKARSQGADYIADRVVGIDRPSPAQVTAVSLAQAGRVGAGIVVNATGVWSAAVARMAGLNLPVEPRKRCVFVIDSPHRAPDGPLLFDTSGLYMRPEGNLYICGITPPAENAADDFGMQVDDHLFQQLIWPALAHRIPGFEQLRMLRA